jgi:GntR family transcriptional repressor for pyruvate dehydrogenase complex
MVDDTFMICCCKAPTMSQVRLSAIKVPKTSSVLARELRRQILSVLPPGSPLPPERDLMAQTGLSRSSVREALRILEAENLVTTRPGRFGGTVANRPDDASLGRSISHFAQGRGVTVQALLQTRAAVEPSLAALAAQHRTEADLQQLSDCSNKMKEGFADLPRFLQENVNWHIAIAAASGNELLRAFMVSISTMIYKVTAVDNFSTEQVRHQVLHAHAGIESAIVSQDPEAARRRMARHLAAATATWEAFPDAPLLVDF